jgi:4-carboxymuconolactone decarboxylase
VQALSASRRRLSILDSSAKLALNEPKKRTQEDRMAKTPSSAARDRVRDTVPKLIEVTENVLFGDIWERPGLSKRDRSLITCAVLVATYRPEQLRGHLERALINGLTKDEISEMITHVAFYGGWPAAMSGANIAKEIFEKNP